MRIFSASACARVWIWAACCWARADLLGLGLREGLDLGRLLLGAGVVRLALVGLDRDGQLRLRERGLLLGPRLGLAQLALLDRRLILPVVRFTLLLGDLARATLGTHLLD